MIDPEIIKLKPPFVELELPISQVSLMAEQEIVKSLINRLRRHGLHKPNLFYAGVNGTHLRQTGTFGNRTSTFAVPEEDYIQIAEEEDKYGPSDGVYDNPYRYALSTDGELAAIVVFDGDYFEPADDSRQYNWQLLHGHSMDEAAIATFYLLA